MKKVKQFRFFGKEEIQYNTPNTTYQTLVGGSLFQPYTPILQLGIQGLPGTKFYINEGVDPVILGVTGIYEMNLQDNVQIVSLSFDPKSIEAISDASNMGLIIDITYEG